MARPFIEDCWSDCYDDAKPKADLDLTSLGQDFDNEAAAFHWQKTLEKIQAGVMPLEDRDQPDREERQAVIEWILSRWLESPYGEEYRAKRLLPLSGNHAGSGKPHPDVGWKIKKWGIETRPISLAE
ncbi:MAG: hypothetical protein PVJ98_00610 [Akkermansiaceae bacterium]